MANASATPVTEFTWGIAQLERHTADGVVYTCHYTINANDGTYSAGAYGSIGFEQPDPDNINRCAFFYELNIGWYDMYHPDNMDDKDPWNYLTYTTFIHLEEK